MLTWTRVRRFDPVRLPASICSRLSPALANLRVALALGLWLLAVILVISHPLSAPAASLAPAPGAADTIDAVAPSGGSDPPRLPTDAPARFRDADFDIDGFQDKSATGIITLSHGINYTIAPTVTPAVAVTYTVVVTGNATFQLGPSTVDEAMTCQSGLGPPGRVKLICSRSNLTGTGRIPDSSSGEPQFKVQIGATACPNPDKPVAVAWTVSNSRNISTVVGTDSFPCGKTITNTFSDVPANYWAFNSIEQLLTAGITTGCDTRQWPYPYCPSLVVARDQMAAFLVRVKHGPGFTPPAATGTVFADVPKTYWAAAWIEQAFKDGITTGCTPPGATPRNYCPTIPVARDQMAIFLERMVNGTGFTPSPATGNVFADVPKTYWAAAFIEQAFKDGLTTGCVESANPQTRKYCPSDSVARDQMATFLIRAFFPTALTAPDRQ